MGGTKRFFSALSDLYHFYGLLWVPHRSLMCVVLILRQLREEVRRAVFQRDHHHL